MDRAEITPENVNILLGVTGGVAAYKAVDLASKLSAQKYNIKTVMTDCACELIRPKSFEAVTNSIVYTNLWEKQSDPITHISLTDWADMIIIAPATANIIGKAANGICDDLLSTILCACWNKAILAAPAMNDKMWSNPAVQKNIEKIKKMGFEIIGPETGRLACGTSAIGRMSQPLDIMSKAKEIIAARKKQ